MNFSLKAKIVSTSDEYKNHNPVQNVSEITKLKN